ncbi:MAG: hypothetical protein K2L54_04075, partial [Clostridiales bacterium]|nr:hypothetical protein [Clostridiales bacterium]
PTYGINGDVPQSAAPTAITMFSINTSYLFIYAAPARKVPDRQISRSANKSSSNYCVYHGKQVGICLT